MPLIPVIFSFVILVIVVGFAVRAITPQAAFVVFVLLVAIGGILSGWENINFRDAKDVLIGFGDAVALIYDGFQTIKSYPVKLSNLSGIQFIVLIIYECVKYCIKICCYLAVLYIIRPRNIPIVPIVLVAFFLLIAIIPLVYIFSSSSSFVLLGVIKK